MSSASQIETASESEWQEIALPFGLQVPSLRPIKDGYRLRYPSFIGLMGAEVTSKRLGSYTYINDCALWNVWMRLLFREGGKE